MEIREMKEYTIEVTEFHEVKKTYFINSNTKSEAISRAKKNDWDDAGGDEPTGIIHRTRIDGVSSNPYEVA